MDNSKIDIQNDENQNKYHLEAKRLKQIIKMSGKTQQAFAEDILHMSKNGLQRYLAGTSKLSRDYANMIYEEMGISPEYILGKDTNMNQYSEWYNKDFNSTIKNSLNFATQKNIIKELSKYYSIPNIIEYPDFWEHFIKYMDISIKDAINRYFSVFHESVIMPDGNELIFENQISFNDFIKGNYDFNEDTDLNIKHTKKEE